MRALEMTNDLVIELLPTPATRKKESFLLFLWAFMPLFIAPLLAEPKRDLPLRTTFGKETIGSTEKLTIGTSFGRKTLK